MTNLNIAKLYLANNTNATAAQIDTAVTDGTALTAINALTTAQFVEAAYQAAFGRAADAEGLAYWSDKIDNQGMAADDAFMTALNYGATVYVAPTAETPLVIGTETFTAAVASATDDVAVAANKATAEAAAAAISVGEAAAIVATVTEVATTVTAASDAVAAVVAANTPDAGSTASLTAGADAPVLGAGNDTIEGTSVVNSLTANDTIIDESTTDADTLTIKSGVANVKATIKNIEDIQFEWISNADLAVDATNMTANEFTFVNNGLAFAGTSTITAAGSNNFIYGDKITGAVVLTNVVNSTIDAGSSNSVTLDQGAATIVGQKTTANIVFNNSATLQNTAADLVQNVSISASSDATITLTDGAVASAIDEMLTVTGTNDIVVSGVVTAEKIVNSKTSGTLTVKSTDAGATDVSKIDADNIQLSSNAGAITVADNQTLEVVTGGAPTTIQTLSTLSNVTTSIKTNIGIAALNLVAGAADVATLNLEAAKDVTVALTADATQTTNISGSGKLTLNSTGVSAVDASDATGTFTYTQAGDDITGVTGSSTAKSIIDFTNIATKNATFIGGSEVDTLSIAAAAGTISINTASGDDEVTVSGALTGKATVDLGAGTSDVVTITNVNGVATATGASSVSFVGVEEFNAADATVFNNVQLSGTSYKMTSSSGGTDNLVVFAYDKTGVATEATTDLSSLVFNDVVGSEFTTTAITGLDSVEDTIKATKLNDTIDSGTSKDTIDISQGGADIIDISADGDSTWSEASDNMTSVTGFNAIVTATAADNITFDTDITGEASGAAGATDVKLAIVGGVGTEVVLAEIDANAMLTLSGVDSNKIDTLAEWIDVAERALEGATTVANVAAGETIAFAFSGNTYLYNAVNAAADNAIDSANIVELVGVTGITSLNFAATAADNTILVG